MEENYKRLDIYNKDIIEKFDGMYVDFYLEDDMFEIEGQFFTIDGQLYIEVHDSVMHILEMAGKELRVGQVGELFTATRPVFLSRTSSTLARSFSEKVSSTWYRSVR